MKKSKKVLLSAAIAAAIMGSVSLPQIQAAEIGTGVNLKATSTGIGVFGEYDVKTTNPNLNTTLATQEDLIKVNSELAGKAKAADIAQKVTTNEVVADNVKATNVNASNLSVSGKAEFTCKDGVSISDDLTVGGHVEANTINATGGISSNQINGTRVNADNLDANTTQTGSLQVKGDARLEGTTLAKEIGAGKLAVGNINDVEQAINNNKAAADNAQSTANAAKDAAAANKTAITKETNDRTAADTVLSNRITDNSTAIQSLRHDVSDLGTEIDNVGAISAALAGLHPLDWNGSGSKFQLSAAAGTYDGKQAMALGGFYHPNRNMMLSLGVSSSFGSDRKTAGNIGITFRVGKGSNGTVSDDVAERLAAMDQKISQLESQNQKLTSMLAIVDPSLTKEFPDVPANHWAYEAVSKLAGNDIIEGYPDGDFHGDRAMTRYEIAQVIYKALKKGGTVDQKLVKEFNKEIEAVKANDAQ